MNFLGYAGYRIKMNPIDILDLKRFKGAVFSYGSHSPYVHQMLNSWATKTELSSKTAKIWQQQYWNLILGYND